MNGRPDVALTRMDEALLRLRRFWDLPRAGSADEAGGDPVELSTVLVVEVIGRAGGAGHGAAGDLTIGAVGAAIGVEASTASRLVERAVAAGAVQRRSSAADARRVALTLTPAGEALRERSRAFRTGRLAGLLEDWSDADRATFVALLERFADEVARERGR
jgi:DNA-binding MarR family transcriptional regulator